LHELGHVKRRDCLTQLITQIVCAVYWFNPLVWLASHHMLAERERACDDLVLATGTKPSDYAEHILQIAASQSARPLAAFAGIRFARCSKLEDRLLAILDKNRNRRAMTRPRIVAAIVLLAAIVVPVAILGAKAVRETRLRTCLTNIIDDIAAIKHKYPELAQFDADAAKKAIGPREGHGWCMRLQYSHEFEPARSKLSHHGPTFGKHGCNISVQFFPDEPVRCRVPERRFPSLGVITYRQCRLPRNASPGLYDAVTTIIRTHLDALVPGDRPARGNSTQGVLCRLRTDQTIWQADEAPVLKADIFNSGPWGWQLLPAQKTKELEVDGLLYRWAGPVSAKGQMFLSRGSLENILFTLDTRWRAEQGGKKLALSAGKHTIRVAITATAPDSDPGPPVRVLSNPVEIEIQWHQQHV